MDFLLKIILIFYFSICLINAFISLKSNINKYKESKEVEKSIDEVFK